MFGHVTTLQDWKSEHTAQSCEDAAGCVPQDGLFAVADGVGTALFSGIWSRCLVETFLDFPLLSDDPFETEWWLREAQQRYLRLLPSTAHMPWNVQQKALTESSYSTLASVRFQSLTPRLEDATVLAFGDSCIFVRQPSSSRIATFPPLQPADFAQPPLCLPSKLSAFQRYFHRARVQQAILQVGSTLILATDAVAHWLIASGPANSPARLQAFETLAAQTPATWEAFVRTQRQAQTISDDDCTALILTLHATSDNDALVPLGTTSIHRPEVRARRAEAFVQAVEAQQKELAAILFGDGCDLAAEGLALAEGQLQQARQIANALSEVLQVLRREIGSPTAKERILPIWRANASLLANESCAAPLHETLQRLGIALSSAGVVQSVPEPLQIVSKKQDPIASQEPREPVESPQPQLSEAIFRKACRVKQAYLFHTSATRLSPIYLEQSTIIDLIGAPLIAAGIAQANRDGASPLLQVEVLLPTILEEFRRDRYTNYERMVRDASLTEEDVKNIVSVLLSHKLFEEYLFWERAQQLDDWLVEQSGGPARLRLYLLKVCPWIVKLSWWKQEVSYA